jgi:hypothetical protein
VIQAVKLTAGSHEVWFVFRPFGSKDQRMISKIRVKEEI